MTESFEFRGVRFEWDSEKAARNFRVHGVSFEEAASAFLDEFGETIPDPDHSEMEDRFVLIGWSGRRTLIVIHVERGTIYRIISARKAKAQERSDHEQRVSERKR